VPRIIVQAEPTDNRDPVRLMAERVLPSDLESDHFAAQLIERLGWALDDADQVEHAPIGARS
jgi:hypothetical protein